MDEAAIAAFLERSLQAYVADLVAAGMEPEQAARKGRADQGRGCPNGRPAPGHLVFSLLESGRPVGHVWIGPDPEAAAGGWWVNDVEIDEQARGRGLGRRLMELTEDEARRHGGTVVGLNVFGTNARARRLYESLGYEPTAIRMRKLL